MKQQSFQSLRTEGSEARSGSRDVLLPACVSTMGDSEGNANNSPELPRPGSHLAVIPCSPSAVQAHPGSHHCHCATGQSCRSRLRRVQRQKLCSDTNKAFRKKSGTSLQLLLCTIREEGLCELISAESAQRLSTYTKVRHTFLLLDRC